MIIVCDKCGGKNVSSIAVPPPQEVMKLSEFVHRQSNPVYAAMKPGRSVKVQCNDCGFWQSYWTD